MTTVYDLSSNFGLLKLGEFGIEPCNIWIKIFKEKLHVEVEENEIKIAHSTENYKEEGINTAVHNGNKTRLVLIKFLSHIKIKEEGHETDPKKKKSHQHQRSQGQENKEKRARGCHCLISIINPRMHEQ